MGEDRSLRASPLLRGLPDDEMALIAGALRPTAFARGDLIVRQGYRSDAAYIIASGRAAVVAADLTGQEVTLRVFGPNDTFGEVGLLTGEPRSATVRAQTEVAAYVLDAQAFERIRPLCPELVQRLEGYADLLEMDRFLQLASPFRGMSKERIREIASRMRPLVVAAGTAVVRQGDVGDLFYFIRSGSLEVLKDGKRVHVLAAGDVFGEIALLTGGPRIATVRATSAAELYTLSKADFDTAIRDSEVTRGALQELTRIRYRATMGQPVVLPDPVSTLMPFLPARSRDKYWKLLLGGLAVFAVSTILAITSALPFALYAGLIAGSLVIPIVYVAYLAETGIVSERPLTLAVTFVLGAVLGLPVSFFLERQLGLAGNALGPSLLIATIEEVAKILGVVWLLRRTTARFQMDGIIFGAAAGMGFAAFETMLFGFERLDQVGALLATLWVRAALSPLGHGTWTAIVSGIVWRQKTARGIRIDGPVLLALGAAIALHGLWDWQPLGGLWNIGWSLAIGVIGIVLLRTVVQRATAEELSAVVALNPDLAQASPNAPRLACRICEEVSPPGAHYCVRCGAALVGTAGAPARRPAEPGRLVRVMRTRAVRGLSFMLVLALAVGAAGSAITVSGGAGIAVLLSVGAEPNLVKNGDFTRDLSGWTANSPKALKGFGFPAFDWDSAFGAPAAAIEVALGADGYLEQEIDLPSGFEYELSLQTARLTFAEVTAYVTVIDAAGKATELDRFVPGCTAQTAGSGEDKTYDLSNFAGQKVRLRLGAVSTALSFDRRAFFSKVSIRAIMPGIARFNALAEEKADCPLRAWSLTPGTAATPTLAAGEVEFFRLDARAGYQYTVRIDLGTLENARLAVYRSDLAPAQLVESEDRKAKALVVAVKDGTYYVAVRGLLLKHAGDYTISVVESTIDGSTKP